MRSLYIIYSTPAFPTKHLTIYPRTPESNPNRLENIFIKHIILMTRSGCRKREKRQREYNHSFVSHIRRPLLFILSFPFSRSVERVSCTNGRTTLPLSVYYFFALSPFVLVFSRFSLYFIVAPGTERLVTDVVSSLALLHRFFPVLTLVLRLSAFHLLSSRLFLCLPGNLAVVMRRSAQPLGWWGWKKGKGVTRGCVGGRGHRS